MQKYNSQKNRTIMRHLNEKGNAKDSQNQHKNDELILAFLLTSTLFKENYYILQLFLVAVLSTFLKALPNYYFASFASES